MPSPVIVSKYTTINVRKIIEKLEQGHTREAAAAAGDVTAQTMRRWMAQYPDFNEKVQIAEGKAESAYVSLLNKAAMSGEIKAIMFWLERRRPYAFGRVDRVDMIVRLEHANQARDRLKSAGVDNISIEELMAEYEMEAGKQKALPPGTPGYGKDNTAP